MSIKKVSLKYEILAAAGVSIVLASPAYAQAQSEKTHVLEEVVVTAERRSSTGQRTAASVAVRSGDQLREEGKYLLRDILQNVPGVVGGAAEAAGQVTGGGSDMAGPGVTIRGIRSSEGAAAASGSIAAAVALYTDDVYEGVGSGYDLDRVEILRGPQGTLYGRSATGGVIATHTRSPNLTEVEGFGLAEAGSDNLRHVSAGLSIPIVDDRLAVRVSGDYFGLDGFDADKGLGYRINKNARIKILARPSGTLSVLLGAAMQDNEDATGGLSPRFDGQGDMIFQPSPLGAGKNQFRQYWANIQWDLGFATLTYIPAYRSWEQDALLVGVGPGINVKQTLLTPKDDFITHEARLTSSSDGALKWQVGALSYDNDLSNSNTLRFDVLGDPLAFSADTQKRTRAFGVFGEFTYSITDAWRITGGLRYDDTKIDVDQVYTAGTFFTGGGPPSTFTLPEEEKRQEFGNWTYKMRTEYSLTPQNLIYASFSTGFTPGDVSLTTDITNQPVVLVLEDQTLKAYELGSKNRFLDGRLQVNGSLYYYDYSGFQTAAVDIDPGPALTFMTLVAPLKSIGGELELLYQATPNDRLGVGLAYTDAHYVNQSTLFRTYIARDKVAKVPPFTANVNYSHRFDLPNGSDLTVHAEARYLSAHDAGVITQQQLDVSGTSLIRQKAVAFVDLRTTWTSPGGKYSVGAYVRNIGDERIILHSALDTIGATLALSAPRTMGIVTIANF